MAENNFVQNATSDIVIDALMGVTDPAAVATDILLDQLIDALINHYAQAASDIEEKGAKYFNKFKDADAKKFADFQAGKITKEDYTKWRAQKMLTGDHYKDLRDVLVSDMNNANQIATDIINNKKPDVYALNHNYGVYEIEHSTGLATSYVMYDHDTVENLIAENPQILPKNKIDIPADKKWNTQKINNALTQGVLQGESIPDISKRLREVTDMNKNAAIRNARTAVTGAQNAGRDDSYKRAESMGIPVDQIWISTLDGRTRHSHRTMMGEVRKGKTFSNGLRYPGDPWGAGEEVYNCRCTMIANVNDVDYGIEDMVNRKLKEKDMTWDEWVNEQPLPKHYNESKAHYLQRYSEHKKKLSFKEWLGEQADPDSAITSMWGKKGWSNVFYDIQNKSHADANALKKELTALANQNGVKPKDIWSQYLTGQLDAEDMNKLENILKKYLPDTSVSSASDAINKAVKLVGGKNDPEITDNIRDYFLPPKTREKLDWIENIDTYDSFEKYLKKKGIDLDVGIDKLKNEMKFDSMPPAVKKQCQKIAVALEAYEDEFGPDCLSKLKKIYLYDDALDAKASYFFNTLGEHDPLAGEIHFRDWNASGHDVFHELAHAFQDSHAIEGTEDALLYSKRMVKEAKMPTDWQAYTGAIADEAMDAERFAEAFGYAFTHNSSTRQEFVYNVANIEGKTIKVPKAVDKIDNLDNISDAAKQAESQLKFTKGNAMTKEQADTYKVNPMYKDITGDPSHINCQTTTFAYECRRQGYDVVALTKDASVKDVFDLQDKLGKDQGEGWINKITGKKPDAVISHSVGTTQSLSEMLDELENAIGKNGERYTLGVKFKSGGAHAINLDRDENGLLRIIDNQKGTPLKNTWVGKEVKDYFSMKGVEHIRKVYRVDDCVPNPEFFNKIVKQSPTSIVKTSLAKGDDVVKILDDIKDNLSGAPIKNILLGDNWSEYVSIMSKNHSGEGTLDTLWQKYLKGDLKDPDLDKLISKMYGLDVVETKKIDDALELFKKNHSTADLADILDEAAASGHVYTASYIDKYLKNEVTDEYLDDLFKAQMNKAAKVDLPNWVKDKDFDLINLQTGEVLDKVKELEKIKSMPITDLDDMAKKLTKDYYDLKIDDAKKMLKESGLNIPEKTVTTKTGIDMDALKNKKVMDIYHELEVEGTHGKFYTQLKSIGEADGLKQGDVWKKYLNGELSATDTAKIEQYLGKYKIADKVEDINNDIAAIAKKEIEKIEKTGSSYYSIFNELEKIDTDLAVALNDEIIHLKHEEHFINKYETLNAYLNGDLKSDKLDEIFTKFYGDKLPSTNPYKGKELLDFIGDPKLQPGQPAMEHLLDDIGVDWPNHLKKWANGEVIDTKLDELLLGKKVTKTDDLAEIKKTLPVKYEDLDNVSQDLLDAVDDYFFNNHFSLKDSKVQWEKYVKGEINDPALDKILKDKIPTTSTMSKADKLDLLKNKFGLDDVDDIADKLWQDGEIFDAVTKTNPTISHMEYLIKYTKGEISNPEIDALLGLNKATDKVATVPEVDLFALQNKSMSQVFNELKADKLNSKFYTELQKHGKPSEVWEKYLNGELTDDASKKIDDILIKKYSKGGINGQTAKTIQTAENPEELIKAQEKLKKAQEELEEIKKELTQIPNKTYTGIWKNDVTLADYESKQSTLAAKKQYYYDQIEELEHCIDDPDSWQFKKYGGEEGLNKKIAEYEKYIDDLNEFEIKGKEYLDEKTKIDKKIKKAEKAVTDAQDEVRQLTPVGEAFTQERKDAAVWAKNKTDEYKKVDKYYETVASKVHGSKTSIEHEGYYHYTWGSGPFNEPLYMFRNIDANGYGSKIRGLTSLIEKSSYDKDIWIQSAQNHITIEAFLGIKPGTLANMTEAEAQQFIGVQNEIPQFLSGAVNKYGGSYNPGNMTVNIYCPAGSEVLYVRDDGHFGKNEHEMILQRGGTYKLTKIYKGKGTHNTTEWIVDLELHPEVGYNKVQQ